jgi:hypothetical protein
MPEPWAAREFAGADLPHERFRMSLTINAENLASNTGSSYSASVGHGGRQAARRLFHNKRTTVQGLLKGHVQQSAARCAQHDLVLCIQDTTTLDYSRHRSKTGLGPISSNDYSRGLLAHSVLALSPDGLPLGVLHLDIWSREHCDAPKRRSKRERDTSEKESGKWLKGLRAVNEALSPAQTVLMVQDREADVFDLLAEPRRARTHLLIRVCHPRRVELLDAEQTGEAHLTNLIAAIEQSPIAAEMRVEVPRKPGQPQRDARLAMQFRSMRVLPPINGIHRCKNPQEITVIRVIEIEPPQGVQPICWILASTMPVRTVQDAKTMVRYYALRWTIERLHFTLKSGCCSVEQVQISDGHALRNALAVYYTIAWRVLYLTYLARSNPNDPPEEVLSDTELTVLRTASKRPIECIADAFREIACLAGHEHYANAPQPGVKRIWQGLQILENLTTGWRLATNACSTSKSR